MRSKALFYYKTRPKKNFFYLNILKNDRETVFPMGHIEMLYYCVCVYYFHLRPFPHNSFSPSPRLKSAKIYLTRFLWLMHDVNTEWLLWDSFMTFQCFPVILFLLFNSCPTIFHYLWSYQINFDSKSFSIVDLTSLEVWEMNSEIYWKVYCMMLHKRCCLLSCFQWNLLILPWKNE